MRLDPSHKKALIILGLFLAIYAGQRIYLHIDAKQEEKRFAEQLDRVYAANPELKKEIDEQKELVRIYGPQALERGFSVENINPELVRLRDVIQLEDGREKIRVTYNDNQPREEYEMKDGELDGVFKLWDTNGVLIEESEYKNNVLNGLQKRFYTNGSLKTEISYVDGIRSGPMKNWYQDGKQYSEIIYKDNAVIRSISFYPDGSTRLDEKLNEETGLSSTRAFYNNGKISHTFDAKNNKKEGTLVKYTPSGFRIAEVDYKNGELNGWCRLWNDQGKLSTELFYQNGRIDHQKSISGSTCDVDLWRFGFR